MPLHAEYAPSTSDWAREQAELIESSGGTQGTEMRGMPVILMTTLGARSGKLRKTVLMRVEHDGAYAVVASLGGAPEHPQWYYNLLTDSWSRIQDGPEPVETRARLITDDAERAAWWERAVAAFPPYAEYEQKTDRRIPLFVLEPAPATNPSQ